MAWHLFAWRWLIQASATGFLVLLVRSLAALLCRQPVQRIRLIVLSLLGGLVAPWLGTLPIAPRWTPAFAREAASLEPTPVALGASRDPSLGSAKPATFPIEGLPEAKGGDPRVVPIAAKPVPTHSPLKTPLGSRLTRIFQTIPWHAAILVAYGLVSLGLMVWWAIGQCRLAWIRRSAGPVPQAVCEPFLEISGPAGAKIVLLMSDRVALPFTYTWMRPVIILPRELCTVDGDLEDLRYALAHEWSHVERRDAWAWNLASVAGFVLFHQPLFWWLRRQLRLCQDYLADDQAAARRPLPEVFTSIKVTLKERVPPHDRDRPGAPRCDRGPLARQQREAQEWLGPRCLRPHSGRGLVCPGVSLARGHLFDQGPARPRERRYLYYYK